MINSSLESSRRDGLNGIKTIFLALIDGELFLPINRGDKNDAKYFISIYLTDIVRIKTYRIYEIFKCKIPISYTERWLLIKIANVGFYLEKLLKECKSVKAKLCEEDAIADNGRDCVSNWISISDNTPTPAADYPIKRPRLIDYGDVIFNIIRLSTRLLNTGGLDWNYQESSEFEMILVENVRFLHTSYKSDLCDKTTTPIFLCRLMPDVENLECNRDS
ncbi:hypothetical protein RhiirA5_421461 [Rhizophagus irregularis]|uniref:Uncharacterized protein n=1 Tax=Rhizophagus irregularis TaxID=588596 RepID=A0A2N0PDY1_9GLOM|nr:hypothetical protein RhiirA5_421461 [Rhizophagus irregularis]